MKDGKHITLAFETSCDETSVALIANGREVLSNVISSQIKIHQVFGGVVPEIASRHHLDNVNPVLREAMVEAEINFGQVDLVGVTNGPGLVGALLIGLATAKAVAFAKGIPLIGVHHIQGHISANYIEHPELKPPFLSLVASGGHTSIILVKDLTQYEVLGRTRDDAAGEAFDKVARVLGLGYPGGPLIDKIAKEGNPHAVEFKRVFLEKDSLDFSFSGIKTGVLNYLNIERSKGNEIHVADVAASFQMAVMEVIVAKTMMAVEKHGMEQLAMAGGVSANSLLRRLLQQACDLRGIKLYCPSPILCTDNAAMIGCAAFDLYFAGRRDSYDLDAYPVLQL